MSKSSRIILLIFLGISLFAFTSCDKFGGGCTPVPAPKTLQFEILDKDGNSLISSLKDSVSVSYQDNSIPSAPVTKTAPLYITKNYVYPDTTKVSTKYNGLLIVGQNILVLSSQLPSLKTFTLMVNKKSVGTIFVDYAQYQSTYPNLTTAAFTFNNQNVVYDSSTQVGLELLQL